MYGLRTGLTANERIMDWSQENIQFCAVVSHVLCYSFEIGISEVRVSNKLNEIRPKTFHNKKTMTV